MVRGSATTSPAEPSRVSLANWRLLMKFSSPAADSSTRRVPLMSISNRLRWRVSRKYSP
jgi:hypothetical protein